MKPTAIIAEDEILARRKLRDLVAEVPLVDVIAEVGDGIACVRAVDELEPDVLFLDVQMPGLSGLDVLGRTRHRPVTIFTTAYDQFAVAAFELAAVDYLLKPFGRDRFRTAVERALHALGQAEIRGTDGARLAQTCTDMPLTRLFARDRGRIVPIAVDEITRIEAKDDYAAVHAAGRVWLVHVAMNVLEHRLDGSRFVRVHRSHIVNMDRVAAFEPYDGGRLSIIMQDGARLIASRPRSRELRDMTDPRTSGTSGDVQL